MMFWNDDESPDRIRVPDDILDILFGIDCKRIPVDHAHVLSSALREAIPWLALEPGVAVHTVHVAGSQNGWERPTHGTESYLAVSKRTKLTLRIPRNRVEELLRDLPGTRLDLGGETLVVGAGKARPLSKETTLFARYVALDIAASAEDEEAFLDAAAQALSAMSIRVRKALCGKTNALATPDGPVLTRSLMLAGLTPDESIRLQQQGLGLYPLLGCGIFIPHKGIDPVKQGES
jgi:CRISPR-associated protein Cas6